MAARLRAATVVIVAAATLTTIAVPPVAARPPLQTTTPTEAAEEAAEQAAPATPPAPLSSAAESVYAAARPRLLQIRTLLESADRQSSLGSGFAVSADGFALTNYHVVSQYALEPATYRLEYVAPDGTRGPLTLQAIDVVNDLAVVRLDKPMPSYFEFDQRAVAAAMPKGERLFAMGNPLDLGFTIVEGTYNGLVDYSYNERIHFTGALNPGMSGGPTVTADGRVAGVNVAKQLSGELVSFLVPPRAAVALLDKARAGAPFSPEAARAEIARQLTLWQAGFVRALAEGGFRPAVFGPYVAPESAVSWLNCWARTNADTKPKPRAILDSTQCKSRTSLFVADDLQTGRLEFSQAHVRSVDLNTFQFAAFVSQQFQPSWFAGFAAKRRLTPQQCHEDFVAFGGDQPRPVLRAVWCARAYREFEGLYDLSVLAVTQDRDREALVSSLEARGITYENALLLGRRFLGSIGYARAAAPDAAKIAATAAATTESK